MLSEPMHDFQHASQQGVDLPQNSRLAAKRKYCIRLIPVALAACHALNGLHLSSKRTPASTSLSTSKTPFRVLATPACDSAARSNTETACSRSSISPIRKLLVQCIAAYVAQRQCTHTWMFDQHRSTQTTHATFAHDFEHCVSYWGVAQHQDFGTGTATNPTNTTNCHKAHAAAGKLLAEHAHKLH